MQISSSNRSVGRPRVRDIGTLESRKTYSRIKYDVKQAKGVWQFTYESWLAFWGTDINPNGRPKNKMKWCRYSQHGVYSPENCYKYRIDKTRSLDDYMQGNVCKLFRSN